MELPACASRRRRNCSISPSRPPTRTTITSPRRLVLRFRPRNHRRSEPLRVVDRLPPTKNERAPREARPQRHAPGVSSLTAVATYKKRDGP